MEDLRRAIYHETFLQLYDKWQIGKYYSSRGLINIEDITTPHLINAIKSLETQQEKRTQQLLELVSDGGVVEEIQKSYQNQQDVLSIKKRELERELALREYME